jgi:large subunit ribosomal protein L10
MAHVADYKKKQVEDFVKLLNEYPIIGAINMENMPTPQLQKMRTTLRQDVVLRVGKRRLIKLAIEEAKKTKPGLEKLEEHLEGMPGLLFTKENPFKLSKILRQNKSAAPAKAGQKAPKDVWVKAGPTSFAPGPILSELGQIGLKAGVEGGKVAIKQDTCVVKEGEKFKPNVAAMLTRLGIEPMEIGLDLVAIYENGTIFTKSVLNVDDVQFMKNLQQAHSWAFNLSVEAGYIMKDNIEYLLGKAHGRARSLALEANVYADGIMPDILAKATMQMQSLKSIIGGE